MAALREQIEHLMRNGPEPERKAVMQALVEEIRVVSRDEIIPTYRVPGDDTAGAVLMPDGSVDLFEHYEEGRSLILASLRLGRTFRRPPTVNQRLSVRSVGPATAVEPSSA